jgi:hypothetical protein
MNHPEDRGAKCRTCGVRTDAEILDGGTISVDVCMECRDIREDVVKELNRKILPVLRELRWWIWDEVGKAYDHVMLKHERLGKESGEKSS